MIHSLKVGVFWVALNTDYYISRHKLIENKKKSRLYALIWDYSFINFQQKVPPIRLFSPIFLLLFKEFSHLYFYSDPSSIRNSRVCNQNKRSWILNWSFLKPRKLTLTLLSPSLRFNIVVQLFPRSCSAFLGSDSRQIPGAHLFFLDIFTGHKH